MTLSVIFIVVDILAVTPVISLGVINPFWKFAFIFKCLTDTIILDDFKTALDKLSRHKMSRILPVDAILNAENLSDNHHNWQKRVSWLTGSDDPCAERVEDVRRRDSGREVIRYPPRALWSTQASSSAQR
jgi:hypothetical protein